MLATGLPATEQLDGRQRVALERRRASVQILQG